MEFDPSFQGPQHLSYISRSNFPENPNFKPHTQTMFSQQNSIPIPPSPIMFHHPNNSFHHFQDHINVSTHNPTFMMEGYSLEGFNNVHRRHHAMLAPNNNNNKMMDALHGNHHKGKAIWDFSQKTVVNQSDEDSSSSKSSPSPLSLSNTHGRVRVLSEHHKDLDQKMQQQNIRVQNNTNNANDKIIKGQWTPEEDSALVELVKKFGLKKWSEIAKLLRNRIGKQCRERWYNHLKPNTQKGPWTIEEDMILIRAHQEVGNKWAKIAKRLPDRPENTIKNHWNTTKRRLNCKNHKKNQHSLHEGSMLYAYAKWVAAIEEAEKAHKKSKKNKKVLNCNHGDLSLLLGYDHCSQDVFNGSSSGYVPMQVNNNNVDDGNIGNGVIRC